MSPRDKQKGPQAECFDNADKYNHLFFVAKQYPYISRENEKETAFSYKSYGTVQDFLDGDDKSTDASNRTFMELIREGRPCLEYYDIEWELDDNEISTQEQTRLDQLLKYRNSFAPEYPVLSKHCRITSASSRPKKGSMHVVVFSDRYAFHNNHIDMSGFMKAFEKYIFEQSRHDVNACIGNNIDWNVYTRNRGMRCLGSVKCTETTRPLIKAAWHIEGSTTLNDREFYITNVPSHVQFIDVNTIARVPRITEPSVPKNIRPRGSVCGTSEHLHGTQAAMMAIFRANGGLQRGQFDARGARVDAETGDTILSLRRIADGQCVLCARVHTRENAFLRASLLGEVFFGCYRNRHKPCLQLGLLSDTPLCAPAADDDVWIFSDPLEVDLADAPAINQWATPRSFSARQVALCRNNQCDMFVSSKKDTPWVAYGLELAPHGTRVLLWEKNTDMIHIHHSTALWTAVRKVCLHPNTRRRNTAIGDTAWMLAYDFGPLAIVRFRTRTVSALVVQLHDMDTQAVLDIPYVSAPCAQGNIYTVLHSTISPRKARMTCVIQSSTGKKYRTIIANPSLVAACSLANTQIVRFVYWRTMPTILIRGLGFK